jgi:hypothetical protein
MHQARERLLILIEQQALSVYDAAIKESLPIMRRQYGEGFAGAGLKAAARDAKT